MNYIDAMNSIDAMNCIDAHVHVWTDNYQRFPFAGQQDQGSVEPLTFFPENILGEANPCGVGRVVLVQMSYYETDNSYMLHVMAEHPGVFAGIGIVDPAGTGPDLEMVRLKGQGVRGFRVYQGGAGASWLDGNGFERMFRAGAEHQLAICPLLNPEALPALERQCTRFPETPVIVDHLARIGADGEIRAHDVAALCALSRFPRVMVKVSAFYALGLKQPPHDDLAPLIRQVYESFGPERLMWASDCPYQVGGQHTYKDSVDLVRERLDFLSRSDRDQILGRTAQKFFFD